MTFNANYKRRLTGILNWLVTDDEKNLDQVKSTDDYFTGLLKPKRLNTNDTENTIYSSRREFEMLCATFIIHNIQSPEKMTVFRFFTTLKYFEKKKQKQQPKQPTR